RLEVFHQPVEGRLERIMILPVREVGDEIFPDLDAQVFSAIRVEALPITDGLEVDESDREELPPLPLDFGPPRLADLGPDPFAVHALGRKDQQQLVMDPDRLIDLLVELLPALHVFGCEPDSQSLVPHLAVESLGEVLILRAVADEARIELD